LGIEDRTEETSVKDEIVIDVGRERGTDVLGTEKVLRLPFWRGAFGKRSGKDDESTTKGRNVDVVDISAPCSLSVAVGLGNKEAPSVCGAGIDLNCTMGNKLG